MILVVIGWVFSGCIGWICAFVERWTKMRAFKILAVLAYLGCAVAITPVMMAIQLTRGRGSKS